MGKITLFSYCFALYLPPFSCQKIVFMAIRQLELLQADFKSVARYVHSLEFHAPVVEHLGNKHTD